ncbi:hypothetical protein AB0E82_32320 [Streptomyces anulatus]|uniref:hypothetical protein n=1 Tax=Streptomyces anulatus TaxID=1892 RepID=UPI0033DE8F96
MSDEVEPRPLEEPERDALQAGLDDLAWTFAKRAAGLAPDDQPAAVDDAGLSDDGIRAARLARAAVFKQIEGLTASRIRLDVGQALEHSATLDDVAAALGVSRQAVAKRFGDLRRGERVVVVISRRDRVREYPADSRVRVGEVGGPQQYDSDRGVWPAGRRVRAEARHAVVAVDGVVRRIYALDPDGWREAEPGKWEFTAVGGRELDAADIAAAYGAGELPLRPGDSCPTRAGGAYRPCWF